jgi:hypothetical protein
MLGLKGKLAKTRAWTEQETTPQWKRAQPEEERRSVEALTMEPMVRDWAAAPVADSPAKAGGKEHDIYDVEKIRAIIMEGGVECCIVK